MENIDYYEVHCIIGLKRTPTADDYNDNELVTAATVFIDDLLDEGFDNAQLISVEKRDAD